MSSQSSSTPHNPTRVIIGRLHAAHGIKGAMKLESFCSEATTIFNYQPLFRDQSDQSLKLKACGQWAKGWLVMVEGIADRTQAEQLCPCNLTIDRAQLPQTADDEVYHHDLVGLNVFAANNHLLGVVQQVVNYGAGDILEILPPHRKDTLLIPLSPLAIHSISPHPKGIHLNDVPGLLAPAADDKDTDHDV